MEKSPPLQPWTTPRISEISAKLGFCTCPLAGNVTKNRQIPLHQPRYHLIDCLKLETAPLLQHMDAMGDVWVNFDAKSWMFSGGNCILIVCSDLSVVLKHQVQNRNNMKWTNNLQAHNYKSVSPLKLPWRGRAPTNRRGTLSFFYKMGGPGRQHLYKMECAKKTVQNDRA